MAMAFEEQVRLLSMVDILEPLSQEELEGLARRAPDHHLGEGEVFLTPFEECERLFILKRGRVQVYEVASLGGAETTLSVVEGGNVFGESVLTGQRLTGVYARALEPSVCCSITRTDLERIILNHPEVGLRLVRSLSERLREAEIRLAEHTHKGVPARLASLLLRLGDKEGVVTRGSISIPTRYTHVQLGTMIGAKRVAVGRALKRLRQTGAVEVGRGQMHLRNTEILERIAGVKE